MGVYVPPGAFNMHKELERLGLTERVMALLKANPHETNITGLLCWVDIRGNRGGPLVLKAIYGYNPRLSKDGLSASVPRAGNVVFLLREGHRFGQGNKAALLSSRLMKTLRKLAERFGAPH